MYFFSGDAWKTWTMIATYCLTIISLFFMKVKYKRLNIDTRDIDRNDPVNVQTNEDFGSVHSDKH